MLDRGVLRNGDPGCSPVAIENQILDLSNPKDRPIDIIGHFSGTSNLSQGDKNENPGALGGATGAEQNTIVFLTAEYRKRAEAATTLCMAIAACHPEDACQIMEAALLDLGAGQPVPPLFSVMDAATDWADWASPAELKAYALASYHRMTPATREAFLRYVRGAQ